MVHAKKGLPVKSQLSVFSTSVFLLLTHTCAGQSQLIGSSQPIVAIVGDDIILPCQLDPAVDAAAMTVEWTRPDLQPRFVYLWRDGHELLVQQNPTYKRRASLFTDKLKLGDVSLKLSNVRLSDEGRYRCFIPSLGKETTMELKVGQPQLIGPPQPIVAIVDDDTILPCHLEPAMDVAARTVEWTRPNLEPSFVHMWRDGVNLLIHQNPTYEGRTSLFMDKLKHGNVSLKLSEVKLSDEGRYKCFIPSLGTETTIELVVGAASSLVINVSKSSSGVVLECESKGWYPEPELFWLDAEGKLLSAGAPETVRGPDGLYTVSSRVTVEKSHSNSFTCRVQQLSINQSRDTHIHVPDDFFMVPSNPAVPVAIGVSVVFLCVVALVFVVCKWKRNKTKLEMHIKDGSEKRERERKTKSTTNNTEDEFLMEGEGNQKQLTAERHKMKDLEKEKLEDELQKKENAGKHQEKKLNKLVGNNGEQEIKPQLEETERERDGNRRKLLSVDREIRERKKTDLDMQRGDTEKDENKKLPLEAETNQAKKKAELEKQPPKMEKAQERTDDEVVRVTEEEMNIEKQQIKEKLEEPQKQTGTKGKPQSLRREAIQTEREKTDLKVQREAAGLENQKLRQETELQSDEPQREKGQVIEAELMQLLEKSNDKLTLNNEHVETVVVTLMEQQRELENQRDELEMLLEEVERQRDEDELNLNLDKRKAELDKEIQKTKEALTSIARQIDRIQNRGSVKNSNEQMQKLDVSRPDESESDEDL